MDLCSTITILEHFVRRMRIEHESCTVVAISSRGMLCCSSADGNYEVTLMTKATVYYSGLVLWQPPAVYKSSCSIDVEFFPYDVQTCVLKLGSWTYDGFKVTMIITAWPTTQICLVHRCCCILRCRTIFVSFCRIRLTRSSCPPYT